MSDMTGWGGGDEHETRIEHDERTQSRDELESESAMTESSIEPSAFDAQVASISVLEQIRKEMHEANEHLLMIRRIMVWVWIIVPAIVGVLLLIAYVVGQNEEPDTNFYGVLLPFLA